MYEGGGQTWLRLAIESLVRLALRLADSRCHVQFSENGCPTAEAFKQLVLVRNYPHLVHQFSAYARLIKNAGRAGFMTDGSTAGFVIDPVAIPALPVIGSQDRFPVRRVYCVGRNYAAHAVEMGHDPDKEPPFFFQKNPDDLDTSGTFPYPSGSEDVHHEVEMMVALHRGGSDIPVHGALDCVYGYGVALDMTRRDLQATVKELGRPWEVAKAFARSAPCSPLAPAAAVGHPSRGTISLDVNGNRRQTGDLDQMLWKVPEIIAHLSRLFTLSAGDVILTGTPAGVGAVERGDVLHGRVQGIGDLTVRVV